MSKKISQIKKRTMLVRKCFIIMHSHEQRSIYTAKIVLFTKGKSINKTLRINSGMA
jgi:hypothetical protein